MKKFLILTLCLALTLAAGIALADEAETAGKADESSSIVLEREIKGDEDSKAVETLFSELFTPAGGTCEGTEGSCTCTDCECFGPRPCCITGCVACWDHRENMGFCGVQ
ncbi:MAG: hypothetical protein AAF481_01895 [Acidobacteriota bacterium]